jgi:hypothetical protein
MSTFEQAISTLRAGKLPEVEIFPLFSLHRQEKVLPWQQTGRAPDAMQKGRDGCRRALRMRDPLRLY